MEKPIKGTENRYWSKIDPFIVSNFESMKLKEIAEELNLPYQLVRDRANKKLKLRKYKSVNWTENILDFLKENYPNYGVNFCSEKLNLPKTAIHKKCNELGIYFEPKGYYISDMGYKILVIDGKKYAEHRLVMSEHIGRNLTSDEIVHHKDENKLNNDISNLEIVTRAEHIKIHREDLVNGQRSKI